MSYTYTLRYVLDPRTNTEKKNQALYSFVKKAQIDDVCFIINGEEINHSHLTKAETQVWLDAIVPLQKHLATMGVTTSLNPWITIMHSDRGFTINPEIGFKTFVDLNGHQAHDMACPADPTWRKYICERYAQYASIHPRRLWIEDDFRHYNHTPLKLMCFCNYHMKIYQEKLGKAESRTDFVKNMLKPGKPTPERKIYLDQARKEMIENEHLIAKAVHKISPETDMGQMTSMPDWHAIEGRDWRGLFDAQIDHSHPRVARPHLPAYNEVAPNEYGRNFENNSRMTAAYLGPDAQLYPELENAMWTPQVKSRKFIAFQIITTALLGAQGIMLNIFDMLGNGINDHWGYAKMLADTKPFATQLLRHPLKMNQLRGIKILVDQDSAYTVHTKNGEKAEELLPHEKNWAEVLASYGFATTILPVNKDIQINNEFIAISGQLLRNFNNDQITHLLKNNRVILDGESVQVLLDRKLAGLLHIKNARWHPFKTGYQSFEQADGMQVQGIDNPRVTMLQHSGNYLQIEYQPDSNVQVKTWAYSSIDQKLGSVITVIDDHIIVMPMDQNPDHGCEWQYSTYKQGMLQQIVDSVTPIDHLDIDMANVKLNIQNDGKVMWISNFSLDYYDKIVWHLGENTPQSSATLIRQNKNQVEIEDINIDIQNRVAVINAQLKPLETIQLIFK